MPLAPGPRYGATLQTLNYLARPEPFLRDCHARYGDIFSITTLLFGPEVCVVRPDLIKMIFTSDADQLRAGEANVALKPVVGHKSVLLLDGAEHLRQRRLMLPPFHGERMLAYGDTMREITERIVASWPLSQPFALHKYMQELTLEVILRTIFGLEVGAEQSELGHALKRLLDFGSSPLGFLSTIPIARKSLGGLSPWDAFVRRRERCDKLIHSVIDARRREMKTTAASGSGPTTKRNDVLTMLLEARDEQGQAMTDKELRDELMTLLVAGHETTATELCWAFDKLLHEPRVKANLVDELRSTEGQSRSESDLPYLDATLKEVLRLAPVIPAVGRRVKTSMMVGGFDVPAGTLLVPGIWLTHRLPDVYPDPEAFKPERFLDKKPDPYAWLPFGGGIRRCVGMAFALFEMKIVLATVLRRVELRSASTKPAHTVLRGITHAPSGGTKVIALRRIPTATTATDPKPRPSSPPRADPPTAAA